MTKFIRTLFERMYHEYGTGMCISDMQKKYSSLIKGLPDNCLLESELEKVRNAKTLEGVTTELDAINLKIINAEALVKKAETDLITSQQRGSHNSCWKGSSPELLGYCVARYRGILQARTRIKNKYTDLKTTLEERLKILQEEEAIRKAEEELEQQQEKENLIQELDEAVEIEIDIAGDVHNEAEEIYEQAI